MRLIDADALLDKMQDYGEGQERLMLIDPYWVRTAPTVERPHGEWIRNDNGTYSCSVCQSWIPNEQHQYARFCLYCGASMRVKNELNRVSKELNSEIEKSKSEIVPDYRDGWRLRGEAE